MNPSKTIRSTRRLLKKDNLPADVRQKLERRIEACLAEQLTQSQAKKEKTLSTRSHKMRFFEQKKCKRRASQLETLILEAEEDKEEAYKAEYNIISACLVYLNKFPVYFKKGQPFISLFGGLEEKNVKYLTTEHLKNDKKRWEIMTDLVPSLISSPLAE